MSGLEPGCLASVGRSRRGTHGECQKTSSHSAGFWLLVGESALSAIPAGTLSARRALASRQTAKGGAMTNLAIQTYSVTDLGTLPGGNVSMAKAINAAGWIVGQADVGGGS